MSNLNRLLWISLLLASILIGCADWQFKHPQGGTMSPPSEQTPQGKTSIGGEMGQQGRGTDR